MNSELLFKFESISKYKDIEDSFYHFLEKESKSSSSANI